MRCYSRGLAYRHKGDNDRAIEDFNQALRVNPSNAEVYYSRGRAYADKGDNDRAIQDCDQALRTNPTYAAAFILRGNAYALQSTTTTAPCRTSSRPPTESSLRRRIYYTIINAMAIMAASIWIVAVRNSEPSDADSFYGRGLAYSHKGDHHRAIQDYNEALRINPNYSAALYNRRTAYAHEGDDLRAIADHGRWLRLRVLAF